MSKWKKTYNQVRKHVRKSWAPCVIHDPIMSSSPHCEKRGMLYLSLTVLLQNGTCIFCVSLNYVNPCCVLCLTILFLGDKTSSHQGAAMNNESIFYNVYRLPFSPLALEHEAPLEGCHSSLVRALENRLQVFMGVHAEDECKTDWDKLERRHNGQGSNTEEEKHLLLWFLFEGTLKFIIINALWICGFH